MLIMETMGLRMQILDFQHLGYGGDISSIITC